MKNMQVLHAAIFSLVKFGKISVVKIEALLCYHK